MEVHGSHVTRMSDATTFDEICVNCGASDDPTNLGKTNTLDKPCTNPVGQGGMTMEEYNTKDKERIASITAKHGN
jgi:hypothetical protein